MIRNQITRFARLCPFVIYFLLLTGIEAQDDGASSQRRFPQNERSSIILNGSRRTSPDLKMSSSRELGEPGSTYFREITQEPDDPTKNIGFDPESTLLISSNTDGTILAVSGVIGEDDDSFGHKFKIVTFKQDQTTHKWSSIGAPIINDIQSFFKDDARADISLSGDGKRLAVAVVYMVKRPIIGHDESHGFVRVYTHPLENIAENWTFLKQVYEGSAGKGGEEIGFKVSLDALGSKIAIGEMYHDDASTADWTNNVGRVFVHDVDTGDQIGGDITGNNAQDYAGASIAISKNGECLVYGSIGAGGATGSSSTTESGIASVYCWDPSSNDWGERDKLYGEADGDYYGYTVAITSDSNFVVVGAHRNDVNGDEKNAGHVRVYRYNGTRYEQLGTDIDGGRGEQNIDGVYYVGDAFGFDVAISELNQEGRIRIVVGAPNNHDEGYYKGQVCVFEWDIDNSQEWLKIDEIYGTNEWDSLGWSVTIDSTGTAFHAGINDPSGASGIGNYKAAEISDEPSSQPSSSPSTSSSPTISLPEPTPETDEFQIRSNYRRFDDSNVKWCATPDNLSIDSKIKMRPCRPFNATGPLNTQIWKMNGGRIQLAKPTNEDWCMYKHRMSLFLRICGPEGDEGFEDFSLDLNNVHTLTFTKEVGAGKPPEVTMVVYDVYKKFSKLFFVKKGSLNPSLDQWQKHYVVDPSSYTS